MPRVKSQAEIDYQIVYDLSAPVFGAAAAEGVTPAVRETVAKVADLTKDTDGSAYAMYSIVLFMVETSLIGVFRSGHSPTETALRC